MSRELAILFGALIGALSTLVGIAVNNITALREERRRRTAAEHAHFVEQLRAQLAEVFRLLFRLHMLVQDMCWFAKNLPDRLDTARITTYEEDVLHLYPEMSGALAVLAGLDRRVYDDVLPLIRRTQDLESQTAKLILAPDLASNLVALIPYYDGLRDIEDRLPTEVGAIFGSIRRRDVSE